MKLTSPLKNIGVKTISGIVIEFNQKQYYYFQSTKYTYDSPFSKITKQLLIPMRTYIPYDYCIISVKIKEKRRGCMSVFGGFEKGDLDYFTNPKLRKILFHLTGDSYSDAELRDSLLIKINDYSEESNENYLKVQKHLLGSMREGIKYVSLHLLSPSNSPLSVSEISDKLSIDDSEPILERSFTHQAIPYFFESYNDQIGDYFLLSYGMNVRIYDTEGNYNTEKYIVHLYYYPDRNLIITRAKSKSNMHRNQDANPKPPRLTAESIMKEIVNGFCNKLDIELTKKDTSNPFFETKLYELFSKYSFTPEEILQVLDSFGTEIDQVVEILNKILSILEKDLTDELTREVRNLLEKELSTHWKREERDKIFKTDRQAYAYLISSEDSENSRVTQENDDLQAKRAFYNNKQTIDQEKKCDRARFKYKRLNDEYYKDRFKLVVQTYKNRDYMTLQFREYTEEEDIINVIIDFLQLPIH